MYVNVSKNRIYYVSYEKNIKKNGVGRFRSYDHRLKTADNAALSDHSKKGQRRRTAEFLRRSPSELRPHS